MSDYEKIFGQLKHSQKLLYSEKLASENIFIKTQSEVTDFTFNPHCS